MPFRRVYADYGARHPLAYSMLTLTAGMLVCMIISVLVSVQVIERANAQERRAMALADQRERAAREAAKVASCAFINKINDAYRRQADELSPPGQDIARAWADLALRCK